MIQRSALVKCPLIPCSCSSATAWSHLSIAQKTTAVKKEESAYTSASTALYQKESENVYARAPTTPAAIIPTILSVVNGPPSFCTILRAKWVMLQNKNKIVKPLASALIRLIPVAAFMGSKGTINKRPSNTNRGAPGGWGICNL